MIRQGETVCTLQGNRELYVENYSSLGSITQEKIVLKAKKGNIIVEGSQLLIEYYTEVDMKISGRIHSIKV